eukprot:131795-Alexandrium_andersonii.AAC.1
MPAASLRAFSTRPIRGLRLVSVMAWSPCCCCWPLAAGRWPLAAGPWPPAAEAGWEATCCRCCC